MSIIKMLISPQGYQHFLGNNCHIKLLLTPPDENKVNYQQISEVS